MRRAIATIALIVAACGGGSTATYAPGAGSTTPAVLQPSSPAAMAELWCPAAALADCRAAIEAAAQTTSIPSAVCVWAGDRWSLVTPRTGDHAGSACGADSLGTIRGVIVAP